MDTVNGLFQQIAMRLDEAVTRDAAIPGRSLAATLYGPNYSARLYELARLIDQRNLLEEALRVLRARVKIHEQSHPEQPIGTDDVLTSLAVYADLLATVEGGA